MTRKSYPDVTRGKLIIRIKIGSKFVYRIMCCLMTLLLIFIIYLYDSQVYYRTIFPLRVILDICLFVLIFIPTYAILRKFPKIKYGKQHLTLSIEKKLIYIIPLINTIFVINTLCLRIPSLGSLSVNMLAQGVEALPFLTMYLLASLSNGFMLSVITAKGSEVDIYDIFVYSVVFMAIQTIASLYGFHLAGIDGLRTTIACLFVLISVIYLYCLRRFSIRCIDIKRDNYFPLVAILSLAFFFYYYFNLLYNHYSDQGVMLANTNSILYRGNLESYYRASVCYPAVGGFYVICFIYTTGLNNVILASVLAFTVAYLLFPIITYKLMKSIMPNSEALALLLSAMSVYMDGIGVIMLPIYKPKIDDYFMKLSNPRPPIKRILNFKISPKMCSLYISTTSHLWFNPYKVFATLAAITSIIPLLRSREHDYELLLSGLLLAQSFINPRASFITLLTLTILWALKKLNFIDMVASVLTCFAFISPLAWTVIYKITASFIKVYLGRLYELPIEAESYLVLMESVLKSNSLLLAVGIILTSIYVYYWLRLLRLRSPHKSVSPTLPLRLSATKLVLLFVLLSILDLAFISLYAYDLLPQDFVELIEGNRLLNTIRYLVFRYHIMMVLSLITLLSLKLDLRIILVVVVMLLPAYFLGGKIISFPVSLAILGMPTIYQIIKHKRSRTLVLFLLTLHLILGTLTSGMYGCLALSLDADPIFLDMPHVIDLLLKFNDTTKVCSGSYYSYYVRRTVKFANLIYSEDMNDCQLCLIDKYRGVKVNVNAKKLLYSGLRLVLAKLTEN